MKPLCKFWLGGGTIFFTIATVASMADARAVGGAAGRPLDGMASSCFITLNGSVSGSTTASTLACTQNVPNLPRYEMSLPVDTANSHVVTFAARGHQAGFPCCTAYAADTAGGIAASNRACGTTSLSQITLSGVATVPNGFFYL